MAAYETDLCRLQPTQISPPSCRVCSAPLCAPPLALRPPRSALRPAPPALSHPRAEAVTIKRTPQPAATQRPQSARAAQPPAGGGRTQLPLLPPQPPPQPPQLPHSAHHRHLCHHNRHPSPGLSYSPPPVELGHSPARSSLDSRTGADGSWGLNADQFIALRRGIEAGSYEALRRAVSGRDG